jgi:hypothetical protein
MNHIKVNLKELKEFQKQLLDIENEMPEVCEMLAKEIAGRLLALIVNKTPVDTGVLRRGWSIGTIIKKGDNYIIEISNDVYYAKYVEYGHRTPEHTGWVEGKFMMTISEKEIEDKIPVLLQNTIKKYLLTNLK